ncbi:hypothetical protein ACIBG5_21625 [Kribbella sp. NPDC050241]|uniref:hypothetical protein n=1 Tax=Kribbella sp. NPDC050241 TaxID=3364115 RepID=UPI00379B5257
MNGRTAQDSRLPVNGTAAADGTNGHGPQPQAPLGHLPADEGADEHRAPAEHRDHKKRGRGKAAQNAPARDTAAQPAKPASGPEAGPQAGPQNGPENGPENGAEQVHWSQRPSTRVNGTPLGEFNTPVRVDEIAVAAMALSENLQAATRGMPESVELRRFRRELDQAASTFRTIAGELEATAGSLVRLAASEAQACGVGWGVCPEHGLTLMNVGDTVTCHILGCHRQNEGAVERCQHPVAYRVVDAAGPSLLTCAGHAIACRLYLDNPVITAAADSMELF